MSASIDYLFHDQLVHQFVYEGFTPQLALEMPSLDKGTWRVNTDGTMATVWKLRPNIFWHDGVPFTSADLIFTLKANKDPVLFTTTSKQRLITSAEAPDPLTFVLNWAEIINIAGTLGPGAILPQHLLAADLEAGGGDQLLKNRWYSSEFVGLGPYKVTTWERGSHIVASRFDQYYMGRPKLDQVIIRFISDPNVVIANILTGDLDLAYAAMEVDAAVEVEKRWQGTGNRVLFHNSGKIYVAETQLRPEYAKPRDAFANRGVRQAFLYAMDRQAIVDAVTSGKGIVADSYFAPDHAIRKDVEPFIPQYPYDVRKAEALLDEAGWARGPGGVRVNVRTGDRMEVEIYSHPDGTRQKLSAIIADQWKAIGAVSSVTVIPAARLSDREYGALRPSWWWVAPTASNFYNDDKLHTRAVPTAESRWSGINYGAYSNSVVDELYDRYRVALDPKQKSAVQQQLVQAQIGDAAVLPMYWVMHPVLMREGVTAGEKSVVMAPSRFAFDWDKN